MGALCSKQDSHVVQGGHQVLGSGSASTSAPTTSASDPRKAAAEAAEKRLKEAQARGTHTSNPKQGQLAAKANKPARFVPEPQRDERLVWD